jgi:hypothetical protein
VTTTFHWEHDFRAPSAAAVFRAYFDPELSAEHDRLGGIVRREEIERHDSAERLVTVMNVFPERQLPAIARPFVSGPLHYAERMVWERAADRIDIDVRPSVLGKRMRIRIAYVLSPVAPGVIRRVYEGDVSVEVALVGGRAERHVIEDIGAVLEKVVPCTQEWLDAHPSL